MAGTYSATGPTYNSSGLFTINNPLSIKKAPVVIGAAPKPGQSNVGSLVKNMPVARTPVVTYKKGGSTGGKTGGTGGGGGGGGTKNTGNTTSNTKKTTYVPVKSAAQRAAEAAAAKAAADYAALKNSTYGSITDLTNSNADAYKSSLLDWQDEYKQKRTDITNASIKNDLTKVQGTRDVLDMVGTGIRSGGVMLNNTNSTNSSAAQGIADAYGQLGRKQLSTVGNTYEMGRNDIRGSEEALAMAAAQQARHADEGKHSAVNSIVSQAADKLGALNQAAAYASLPDRINIENEKARIRTEALNALSQYDNLLSQATANNPALSETDAFSRATQQANAGMAPETALRYTSSVPTQLQGTGPSPSPLPLFTYGN